MRALTDLHCDTLYALEKQNLPLRDNTILHNALNRYAVPWIQVMAVWSNWQLNDEDAWDACLRILDRMEAEEAKNPSFRAIRTCTELQDAVQHGASGYVLAVEDARLLAGKLSRLDDLYVRGIRLLTLTWKGESCIGGAWNTEKPLTPFGRAVVERCFSLGITPDLSHASEQVADEVCALAERAGRPIVATHSNAFSAYPHRRNLRDRHALAVAASGGAIGLSLCPQHLTDDPDAGLAPLVGHLRHYESLGIGNAVCLGGDLDGTALPRGFSSASDWPKLEAVFRAAGLSEDRLDGLFYRTANAFLARALPGV